MCSRLKRSAMSAGSEKTYDCDGETALQASEDAIMYLR